MYKMADFMWYTYSFEGRMVVVLCGVLINSVGWVISLEYRKLDVWMPVQVGLFLWLISCTILFDDVTYSLYTCVVCVYE